MNGEKRTLDVQDIISKLRFLSKVKKGERLQVDGLAVVENTWYAKFVRAWNTMGEIKDTGEIKEGRRKSLAFIKELYETGLRLAKSIINETSSYYTDLWNMLIKGLKDAQPGITNLMNYYESDRLYIAEVETFVDVLNAKINDLVTERKLILDQDLVGGDEEELVIDK
jgi:hypothetical protein